MAFKSIGQLQYVEPYNALSQDTPYTSMALPSLGISFVLLAFFSSEQCPVALGHNVMYNFITSDTASVFFLKSPL